MTASDILREKAFQVIIMCPPYSKTTSLKGLTTSTESMGQILLSLGNNKGKNSKCLFILICSTNFKCIHSFNIIILWGKYYYSHVTDGLESLGNKIPKGITIFKCTSWIWMYVSRPKGLCVFHLPALQI